MSGNSREDDLFKCLYLQGHHFKRNAMVLENESKFCEWEHVVFLGCATWF